MCETRVLYLDKKSESQVILNYLLELNCDVRYVDSTDEAKTQILLDDYDLLISDIDLDDGDSLDFIKEVKQKYEIKTVAVSANKEPEKLLKLIEIKVDRFLTKPLDMDLLESIVKESMKSSEGYHKDNLIKLNQGFTYNTKTGTINAEDGENIVLTKQESSLIKALTEQKDYYCSHEALQSAIGVSGEPATIETLRTVVKKIRKKTYEAIISSLSGVGYRIDVKLSKKLYDISSMINIEPINKRVLIVKGNNKRNTILGSKLSKYGLEYEQVFSLEEAKEALKHEDFDYIILDLHLPDGDGVDLIREKRDIEPNKIIVLSSSEDMHYKEYLYFKGIVDYIEKRDDFDYMAYSIYQTILKVESDPIYKKILLVESSKKIIEQIKDILLPRNYQIDVTNSVNNVINIINHKSYNLIILDLELDGVNSLDFLVLLKKEVDRALPIIMLSGAQRNYSLVRDCYVNGAVECLRKPIFAEEFILKIDQWTEYYKQTLEIKDKHRLLDSYKNIVDNTVIVSKTDPDGIKR